jgi:hypothetical protein
MCKGQPDVCRLRSAEVENRSCVLNRSLPG